MFHFYSFILKSTQVESRKRGRASCAVQLGEKDMIGKRARRHQARPGLGEFSRPEVEHPIDFSETARGTSPGKETFELHSQGSATGEFFKVQIWSQATLDVSFSHFCRMI